MTTSVFCRVKKIIASDSRWSCLLTPNHLAYVDNTGFDKLADRKLHSMVFAGDGPLIAQWKQWFEAPALNFMAMPNVHRLVGNKLESLSVCLLKKSDCKVMFTSGWWLDHGENARFTGSGAVPAKDCYVINGCSKTAITSAGGSDPATGGEIKFVELDTGSNNLSVLKATLEEATRSLHERGFVMDMTTKVVTPFRDLKQDLSAALSALEKGEISISAPTGLPTRCWSESEQAELRKALEEVAREEAEALYG